MAVTTCVVSGTVLGPNGQVITNTTIKAYIEPFIYQDGTVIGDYLQSTTVDVNGNWSLTLVETTSSAKKMTFSITYPTGNGTREKLYLATIPNTPTATFSAIAAEI